MFSNDHQWESATEAKTTAIFTGVYTVYGTRGRQVSMGMQGARDGLKIIVN
jgi:hypothetical protein